MFGKIYFIVIGLFILFTNYYQFITTASYGVFEYANLIRDVLLFLAGLSYFFKIHLFKQKYWKLICLYLAAHLLTGLVKQLLPSSYYGDLEDGQILINLSTFLLAFVLFLPLYLASLQLWGMQSEKKNVRKR